MPAGVRLELAALVEPLAVAVHAVATSGLRPADTVAVFGGGPVGVLTALVAQYHGAQRIIMNEPNPVRAQVAARLGLDVVLTGEQLLQSTNEATAGEGADVVFDCAGHATVAPYLTEAARPTATLVIVGVHKQPVPLDLRRVNFAEQRIQGVRVYTHADFETAVNLAAADTLGLARLPIRTFPLARVSEAFQAAMQPGEYLKVMVQP
jgi:threonine dehydrogenase-like Zn-dependent dehydrogenase